MTSKRCRHLFIKSVGGLKCLRADIPIRHRLCVNLLRWGLKPISSFVNGSIFEV